MKVTVEQMKLTKYRICRTISGRFFIQYLKETDGFWTLTGEPKSEWKTAMIDKKMPFYFVEIDSARDKVMMLIQDELEEKALKLGIYAPVARLLSFDMADSPILRRYISEVSDGD